MRWNREVHTYPRGLIVLIFFGVLPYLVARVLTLRTAVGAVPISEEGTAWVDRKRRAMNRKRVLVGGAGVVAAACGFAVLSTRAPGAWAVIGVVLVVAALGAVGFSVLMPSRPISFTLEPSGRWVVVHGAHSGWARAVEEFVGRRPTRTG